MLGYVRVNAKTLVLCCYFVDLAVFGPYLVWRATCSTMGSNAPIYIARTNGFSFVGANFLYSELLFVLLLPVQPEIANEANG